MLLSLLLLDFRPWSAPDCAKDREKGIPGLGDTSPKALHHLHILPIRPGEAKPKFHLDSNYDSTSPPVSKAGARGIGSLISGPAQVRAEQKIVTENSHAPLRHVGKSCSPPPHPPKTTWRSKTKLHLDSTTQHLLPCPRLEPEESAL